MTEAHRAHRKVILMTVQAPNNQTSTCLRLEAHLRRERRAALQLHLGANVFRGAGHNGAGQASGAASRQHLPEGELALRGGVLHRVG